MLLLKIVLISFAIYYILKSAIKFLLPPELRNLEKKMREQSRGNFKRKKEGEVTIERMSKKKNDYGKGIGEYVDFEEIKD